MPFRMHIFFARLLRKPAFRCGKHKKDERPSYSRRPLIPLKTGGHPEQDDRSSFIILPY